MKRKIYNIRAALLLFPIILLTGLIQQIPWWSFVIPVMIFGSVIGWLKWDVSCFLIGFLVGFLIWSGANVFFDLTYRGVFLDRLGSSIKLLLLFASGIPGGILTGLALYIGHAMVADNMHKFSL